MLVTIIATKMVTIIVAKMAVTITNTMVTNSNNGIKIIGTSTVITIKEAKIMVQQ